MIIGSTKNQDHKKAVVRILPNSPTRPESPEALSPFRTVFQGVAELTGLNPRAECWVAGLRLIARRTRPATRHKAKPAALERATGWRYGIVATNIIRMWGIPGSHHSQWLDCLHRSHAAVENRVQTNKAMGLHNLPSKSLTINRDWVLAANIAADLQAWTRPLGPHDQPDLADAEP